MKAFQHCPGSLFTPNYSLRLYAPWRPHRSTSLHIRSRIGVRPFASYSRVPSAANSHMHSDRSYSTTCPPLCSSCEASPTQRDCTDQHCLLSTTYYGAVPQLRSRRGRIRKAHQVCRLFLLVMTKLRTTHNRVIAIHEIVALGTDEGDKAFEEAWVTLCEGRELVCVRTGTRFAPLPKPEAIILDVRALQAIMFFIC